MAIDPSPHVVFTPRRLGPVTLRNRIIKSATFEGMAPAGQVSDRLVEFHRRVAAGGVGMTTLAYCAVSPEGRTYADQIHVCDDTVAGLRRLTDAVHAEGAAAAIQLGHAGWFANPKATGARPLGPSRVFSPYAMRYSKALTAADLDRLVRDYRRAARLAVDAGFDALEVHLGHGYLLSQFLSPYTNRRGDEWGGSLENRARFPRRVVAAVREAVGGDAAVYAKLNMADGFRGGLTPEEGVEVAKWLDADGNLDALELTGGFTSRTPMYLMRGDVPLEEFVSIQPGVVRRLGLRWTGPKVMRAYPFEEAFFLPMARNVRAAVGLPLVLLGGITRLETMDRAMAEGFEFVAMARALVRDPDFVSRLEHGVADASTCTSCNRCIVEMEKTGTRCVLDD